MTTPFPFVSGAVLTAAQLNAITEVPVNDKTASYTLTAAEAGERVIMNSASATTITVNTNLFTAGQVIYITNKGAGVCTVTAGTATVSTTGSLALAQYASGVLYCISAGVFIFEAYGVAAAAAGLTLISATTIGTNVATTTVSNAFSATYDVYKITVSGGVLASSGNIGLKLGATATGYYFGANRVQYAGADSSFAQSNGTSFQRVGNGNTAGLNASFDVINPFLAANTVITGGFADLSTGNESNVFAGYVNNSTSYTAFDLTFAFNATGGTIRVYGYKN